MKIHQLPGLVGKSKRRVGRGHGSGRVKTSGRGTKGQKARGNMPMGFEGGQTPLVKRLPYLRGKGRNASQKRLVVAVDIAKLNSLPAKSVVDVSSLVAHHIVDTATIKVKIIGNTKLSVALTVTVPTSKGAANAITSAGGSVTAT